MHIKKVLLSAALNPRKHKGYKATLPESHVPTIWAELCNMEEEIVLRPLKLIAINIILKHVSTRSEDSLKSLQPTKRKP